MPAEPPPGDDLKNTTLNKSRFMLRRLRSASWPHARQTSLAYGQPSRSCNNCTQSSDAVNLRIPLPTVASIVKTVQPARAAVLLCWSRSVLVPVGVANAVPRSEQVGGRHLLAAGRHPQRWLTASSPWPACVDVPRHIAEHR